VALEQQYDDPAAVRRVRASVLGPHADALAQFLVRRGHARHTIQRYLNALEHLGAIFRAQGLRLATATRATRGLRCGPIRSVTATGLAVPDV